MWSELIEWECVMRNNIESEDRRKFLISCGRFAAVTPPAMTALLSTSLTSTAIARSGLSGHDNGPGSFFDNDPDPRKQASDDRSSRKDQAGNGDGDQASLGGSGGGGGGGDTARKSSRGGGSGSSGGSGGGAGSAAGYGGGEDDKWRRGSRF
jgi:hypothetical protein